MTRLRSRLILMLGTAVTLLLPARIFAQSDTARAGALHVDSAKSVAAPSDSAAVIGGRMDSVRPPRLFTAADRRNLLLLVAATLAVMPADKKLTDEFRDAGPQRSTLLHDGARAFDVLGDPGTIIITLGAYAIGRAVHSEHLADLGLHVGQSLVLTAGETWLAKGLIGRRRPYLDVSDPDEFALGHGFAGGAWASLPSGHTAAAFAVAASANEEIRHWWPAAPWVVSPLLYGGATMVGLARIYDARHWSSDVVLGAGLGILTGRKVAEYRHGPIAGTRWPRWPQITATGRGLSLNWGF